MRMFEAFILYFPSRHSHPRWLLSKSDWCYCNSECFTNLTGYCWNLDARTNVQGGGMFICSTSCWEVWGVLSWTLALAEFHHWWRLRGKMRKDSHARFHLHITRTFSWAAVHRGYITKCPTMSDASHTLVTNTGGFFSHKVLLFPIGKIQISIFLRLMCIFWT